MKCRIFSSFYYQNPTLFAVELQVHKVTGGLEPPHIPLTRRVRCPLRHVTRRPRGDSDSRFPDL